MTQPNPYAYGLKKVHRPGETSLACLALRDGSLDVDLKTGIPYGARGPMKTRIDKYGYVTFVLCRKVTRGGTVVKIAGKERRRKLMTVLVHRLAMMKHLAVQHHGDSWREHVKDLPGTLDVNHVHDHNQVADRTDNRIRNLRLETLMANRRRRPMTPEEEAEVARQVEMMYGDAYEPPAEEEQPETDQPMTEAELVNIF